jgi:iron complex outermembrane receptor protein
VWGGTTVTGTQTPGPAGVPGSLSPANCNISGQWLPGISRWALSYGTQYELPAVILSRSGKAYAAFDGSYRSRFSSNASRSAYTDIAPYAIANLRFGFDKQYFDQLTVASGNTGLVVGQPADPRSYGLTVSVKF